MTRMELYILLRIVWKTLEGGQSYVFRLIEWRPEKRDLSGVVVEKQWSFLCKKTNGFPPS